MISDVVYFGTPQYDVLRAEINELLSWRKALKHVYNTRRVEYNEIQVKIRALGMKVRFRRDAFIPDKSREIVYTPIEQIKRPLSPKEIKFNERRDKILKKEAERKKQGGLF